MLKKGKLYRGIEGYALKNFDFDDSMKEYLTKTAGAQLIRRHFLEEELVKLTLELEEVKFIAIKGLTLTKRIYDDPIERFTSDIDILINESDYNEIKEIVRKLGYFRDEEHYKDFGVDELDLRSIISEILFVKKSKPYEIHLDIHFDLSGFPKKSILRELYPEENYWSGLEYTELNGVDVPCLNLDLEFYNLINHFGIHHSFVGMKWLIDICRFIQKDIQIDVYAGKNKHQTKMIDIVLRMAHEYMRVDSQIKVPLIEYQLYKRMLNLDRSKFMSKMLIFLVKILLPVGFWNKMKVFKYLAFSRYSFEHLQTKKTPKILLPFTKLYSAYRRTKERKK